MFVLRLTDVEKYKDSKCKYRRLDEACVYVGLYVGFRVRQHRKSLALV